MLQGCCKDIHVFGDVYNRKKKGKNHTLSETRRRHREEIKTKHYIRIMNQWKKNSCAPAARQQNRSEFSVFHYTCCGLD